MVWLRLCASTPSMTMNRVSLHRSGARTGRWAYPSQGRCHAPLKPRRPVHHVRPAALQTVATTGNEQVERTRRTADGKHWDERWFWPDSADWASVSKDTVSRITDRVVEEMQAWTGRPLRPVYA